MSVTPITIARQRPTSPEPAVTTFATPPTPPTRVVVVADLDTLTAGNQRGCGDSNPYN